MKDRQAPGWKPKTSALLSLGATLVLCNGCSPTDHDYVDAAEVRTEGSKTEESNENPEKFISRKKSYRPSAGDSPLSMLKVPGRDGYQFGSEALGTIAVADIGTFLMASTETTQGQWREVTGRGHRSTGIGSNRPVETVSWDEAARFCNKLSDRRGLDRCYTGSPLECDRTKNGYRLPTSAEWSLACFGEATTIYPWGPEWNESYCASPEPKGADAFTESHSVRVGASRPNALGIHDMIGNVSEWCDDPVPGQPQFRVYRGGNRADWSKRSFQLQWSAVAPRTGSFPTIGFRVVRNLNGGR